MSIIYDHWQESNGREFKNIGEATSTNTLITGFDLFEAPGKIYTDVKSAQTLPNLTFEDIYIYLIHNPSPYTSESLVRSAKQNCDT